MPITNPYDVLGLTPASSRTEIVKAVATAMKARQHPPKTIADAQKWLMNPDKRLLADYLLPILPSINRWRPPELPDLPPGAPSLALNPQHTGLQDELAAMQQRHALEAQHGG